VIYSSLAFEGSHVTGLTLASGTFVNASLKNAQWRNVTLEHVDLGELQLDKDTVFQDVRLIGCKIDGVRIQADLDDETREYAPARIRQVLEGFGVIFIDDELPILSDAEIEDDSNDVRLLRKLLRMFNRTTIISDDHARKRFGSDFGTLESDLIPLLLEHGTIEERKWRGAGSHRAWTLAVSLDALLAAEGTSGPLAAVWNDLQRRQ
jgi:hypothetical protein